MKYDKKALTLEAEQIKTYMEKNKKIPKACTLTTDEMPSHTHTQNKHRHHFSKRTAYTLSSSGAGGIGHSTDSQYGDYYTDYQTPTINSTGGGQAHNNMPPYLAVNIWKRTA